jgi:hypothetical protein
MNTRTFFPRKVVQATWKALHQAVVVDVTCACRIVPENDSLREAELGYLRNSSNGEKNTY